jgi:hypothetical protein
MASPALAGPANSTIGAKKLEEDMVHSGGVGYPSVTYDWWNAGKKKLDWGIGGELVYADWGTWSKGGKFVRIGLAVNGTLRWNLASNEKPKVTNDVAILFKPGVLISSNTFRTFTFGIKTEIGVPFSIDVHERVNVVTGGFIPLTVWINNDLPNNVIIPFMIRMGVEVEAADKVTPWFYFDLGGAVGISTEFQGFPSSSGGTFAWRLGAGTNFWGVLGKNKNKSNSAATASSEPASEAEPIE